MGVFLLHYTVDAVEPVNLEELKTNGKQPPRSLRPLASDAYLLFQVGFLTVF